jgi:hypothetical protein
VSKENPPKDLLHERHPGVPWGHQEDTGSHIQVLNKPALDRDGKEQFSEEIGR